MHLKLLTLLALVVASYGCATQSVSDRRIESLKYGDTVVEVENKLTKRSNILFRFLYSDNEYLVTLARIKDARMDAVLFYENNRLFALLDTVEAKWAWNNSFGWFNMSNPSYTKLEIFMGEVNDRRIKISDWGGIRKEKHNQLPIRKSVDFSNVPEISFESSINSMVNPFGGPVGYAAAMSVVVPGHLVLDAGRKREIKTYLNKFSTLKLGMNYDEVRKQYGYSYTRVNITSEDDFAIVYSKPEMPSISLGFSKEKLVWIGYAFDARPTKKGFD